MILLGRPEVTREMTTLSLRQLSTLSITNVQKFRLTPTFVDNYRVTIRTLKHSPLHLRSKPHQ